MLPHPDIGDAAFDRQFFTYLEQPIARIPACLNCPPGYRGELGFPEYQMLPHPDIGDAALDRQLFTYLELLGDLVRPWTPGAEAKHNIGDASLYRHLFTHLL